MVGGAPTKTHAARPPGSPNPAHTRSGPRRPHALVFLRGALGIRANAPQGVPPTPCSSRPAPPPPPDFLGGWRGPRPKRTLIFLSTRYHDDHAYYGYDHHFTRSDFHVRTATRLCAHDAVRQRLCRPACKQSINHSLPLESPSPLPPIFLDTHRAKKIFW